jgi:tRNA pseudouridine32 synthase/23S rRNA pseudouridine746 synthase/23S rRNA pseudouridine1911/1915/1917 synthase
MKLNPPVIPKKYQPKGFEILHEDLDLIVVNKASGTLTVAALWERENTVHNALNQYVRKGNPRSKKSVYVVHRLDQATSGVLVFAKTEDVQHFLKNDWSNSFKTYYAIVHGSPKKKSGLIESYLEEDEDYVVRSTKDSQKGKLARTEYKVIKEIENYSLLEINLLTGKKNQIRVHLSELGYPIVGDVKYGKTESKSKQLMLHSYSIELTHPFSKNRVLLTTPVPGYFNKLVP